jgi:hypothetical protein
MTSELNGDLNATVAELKGSLADLMVQVGADVSKPQQMSRYLGLDKSLARKVARIVESDEAGIAIQNLPGTEGFNILLSAVERLGASAERVSRARQAVRSIEGVVERHFGDRPTLEIVVDGLPSASRDRLLLSRKLSFRGDSGIWGIQAKTRVNTAIVAPNRSDPAMLDNVAIGGWVDVRRVRADSRWAVFRRKVYRNMETAEAQIKPLDPNEPPDGPLLLRDFCSKKLPPIEVVREPNGDIIHELGPSAVGNVGAFTVFSGWVNSQIGARYADASDSRGEYGAVVSAPVETLIFDLLVHRDIDFVLDCRTEIYGTAVSAGPLSTRDLIPLALKCIPLDHPRKATTRHIPRYDEVIEYAFAANGWLADEFVGKRFTLDYPPFPSTVRLSFPLQPRPI